MGRFFLQLLTRVIRQQPLRILIVFSLVMLGALSYVYIPVILKSMVEAIEDQQAVLPWLSLLALVIIGGRICNELKFSVYAKWEGTLFSDALTTKVTISIFSLP